MVIFLYNKHITYYFADLPGANNLISHFHGTGVPLAICTGSDATEFEWKTRRFPHWLERIPKRVLSGSDPGFFA
jgi:hypothetical protein